MMTKNEIINEFDGLKPDPDWSKLSDRPLRTGNEVHKYHRYPTKFMPQLVERVLDEFAIERNTYVNDPFMGCGTTLVSALSRGCIVSGTDINPIAYLITKVKTTPIDIEDLSARIKRLVFNFNLMKDRVVPLIPETHLEYINYWFDDKTIDELSKLLYVIYGEFVDEVRDFFLVCFSHILRECSLWKTKSIKPTRDINKNISDPFTVFKKHLMKMKKGNDIMSYVCQSYPDIEKHVGIECRDAIYQPNLNNQVDLIFTSSPYGINLDYCGLSGLSLAWLNLVDDLKEYRKDFIGTSFGRGGIHELNNDIANETIYELEKKDKRSASMTSLFFSRMEKVFEECYRIVKPSGNCVYVVNNTFLKGIEILTSQIFAEYFQRTGFSIDRIIKRDFTKVSLPRRRIEYSEGNETGLPSEYIIIGRKDA